MVLPQDDTIYMVPRPFQKLGGDSHFHFVHTLRYVHPQPLHADLRLISKPKV